MQTSSAQGTALNGKSRKRHPNPRLQLLDKLKPYNVPERIVHGQCRRLNSGALLEPGLYCCRCLRHLVMRNIPPCDINLSRLTYSCRCPVCHACVPLSPSSSV